MFWQKEVYSNDQVLCTTQEDCDYVEIKLMQDS